MRTQGALVAALARIDRVQQRGPLGVRAERPGSGLRGGVGPEAPASRGGFAGSAVVAGALASQPILCRRSCALARAGARAGAPPRARWRRSCASASGHPPERERWPSVSAIVPTRDGLGHLERLFAGLTAHTRYPELEVVVVDNASSDGTLAYLESLQTPFPVHVVANEENLSLRRPTRAGWSARAVSCCCSSTTTSSPSRPGG